ncbi:hypothetical protein [Bradyrhizobium sp. 21]|uniref:hypothetical protein n=1 Tax=Bradyrhizobium sp. 21 TaxID=2782666 RepID=UPI001FFB6DFD|nr:hypothetical protein [Bradyrhizobium sp. 21]MCK1388916.1 hypothetical protein [Bradyrhizobium sp. 21]
MALLFALDRSLTPLGERTESVDVDRTIIRISSARALPEKIIFDTSTQITATISSPALAAEPPDRVASNAMAMAEPPKQETKIPPAPQRAATPATSLRSKRPARAASSHRIYDRQVMVGAF